jgi:transposase-like protein
MDNTTPKLRKRTQRDYNLGFKLQVVNAIEKGQMTYKQAQKIYGIQGRSTVLVWLRKHGKLDWSYPSELPMSQPKETPAQTIKRLERELEDERLRNLILEEMVDYMDQETGGKLRKKSLAKGSENSRAKAK